MTPMQRMEGRKGVWRGRGMERWINREMVEWSGGGMEKCRNERLRSTH